VEYNVGKSVQTLIKASILEETDTTKHDCSQTSVKPISSAFLNVNHIRFTFQPRFHSVFTEHTVTAENYTFCIIQSTDYIISLRTTVAMGFLWNDKAVMAQVIQ